MLTTSARAFGIILTTALLTPLLPAGSAQATSPGRNGVIAWTHVTGFTTDAEVFVIRPDGTGARALTTNDQNDFNPAWSPDGRRIAYESSSSTDVDIYVLDARGERNLTNDPGHADRHPSWSPDGGRLVFSRQSPFTGLGPLFVIGADGTGATRLTSSGSLNEDPAWAPDGSVIAFISDRSGNRDIWTVRPDGTGLRQVTSTPDIQEAHVDWSPDGARIGYDACRSATFPCPGQAPDYEIVTADPDGTDRVALTDVPGIDNNPAWSPDGTKIVFRSDRTGFTQIWVMDADGANQTQLTTGNFEGGVDPAWQPLP
ncbi:MAG: PD40 domain-containing protein [Geodermatophilaceae bacterium]|nr:PD40 domain-containing protein [Geodermatophilaceae bacterium]